MGHLEEILSIIEQQIEDDTTPDGRIQFSEYFAERLARRLEAESKVEWACRQPVDIIVRCTSEGSARARAKSKYGGVVMSRTITPWKES